MAKKAPWETQLQKNKRGDGYLPCLRNAVLILTHAKEWHNVFAFDAFAGVIVKKKRPPWPEDFAPDQDELGEWTREDSMRAVCWLTDEYNCTFYTSVVDEAVQVIAARWKTHPVRDYLNALRWDKKPRIDDLLIRLAHAQDNVYVRAVTKNFFLSAIARIFSPGAQVDTMLILEGEQGTGKSSLLRILASDAWFLDTVFDLGSKDGYQVLRRKWIIEMPELDSFTRVDASRRKAFISSVKDTYRPAYGRSSIDFYRQCVFAGTVNPDGTGYHQDVTGDRRSQPVVIGKVDLRAIREERDQLWAEAYVRYKKGEQWHLRDPKLLAAAAVEAEDRRETHPWEPRLRQWLAEHDRNTRGVALHELLSKAIDMAVDRQDRAAQTKVGKALRAIGWTVIKRGTDGIRRYYPSEEAKRAQADRARERADRERAREAKAEAARAAKAEKNKKSSKKTAKSATRGAF